MLSFQTETTTLYHFGGCCFQVIAILTILLLLKQYFGIVPTEGDETCYFENQIVSAKQNCLAACSTIEKNNVKDAKCKVDEDNNWQSEQLDSMSSAKSDQKNNSKLKKVSSFKKRKCQSVDPNLLAVCSQQEVLMIFENEERKPTKNKCDSSISRQDTLK
jgi:hypothetical protein